MPLLEELIEADEKASLIVYENSQSKIVQFLCRALETSGHEVVWFPLPVVLAQLLKKPEKCGFLFTLILTDWILIGLTKTIFQRKRPVYNKDDMLLPVGPDKYSFPSGHCTRAAALTAAAGAGMLPPIISFGVLPYAAWCGCLGISRVSMGRHHVFDVICGVATGFVYFRAAESIWKLLLASRGWK